MGKYNRFESKLRIFEPALFDPIKNLFDNVLHLTEGKRGCAQLIQLNKTPCFLKHYHRGGLWRFLMHDSYFAWDLEQSRPFHEASLLRQAASLGLRVPRCLAVKIVPYGLFYRGYLLTEAIPRAQTLASFLKESVFDKTQWDGLFLEIQRTHDLGFFHADLNAHNILIDETARIWFLDFDKARFLVLSNQLRRNNIKRLLRSCLKLRSYEAGFHFGEKEERYFRHHLQTWS